MKILHVFDHSLPEQSGYSFRSAAILREQRELGWRTVHLTSSKQIRCEQLREEAGGFEFYRTPKPTSRWSRLPVLDQIGVVAAMRARLREVIAQEQPDLIQAHSPCLTGLAALGLGKPVIYELRSSWEDAAVSNGQTTEGSVRYRLSRALETYVLKRADAITTICSGLRDDVIARGIPADRITIVPNAVDVERFARRAPTHIDMRSRYGLQGKAVLGFAGSFFAWEGLPLLIEALPHILRERSDVRILLVGAGPDEAAVRAAIQRFGVQEFVTLTGQVKHHEVDALYDAMDVLIYPRLPMRLTDMVTPLKPLEAMALSKIFIASDVGGHRELIQHGRTGMLFKAGDPAALAGAVVELLADRELQRRLAAQGFEYVRSQRTWSQSVANYRDVYERLMAAGRSR